VAGDYSNGTHGGNVYAWGMGTKDLKPVEKGAKWDPNNSEYQMRLLRTQDEGKTWTDKLVTTTTELGIPGNGLNSVSDVLISRTGRLYLPFHSWSNVDTAGDWGQWMLTSDDGGMTFSKPYKVKKADGSLLMGRRAGSYPGYAIDNSNGPYKDRVYVVWVDSTAATGRRQLLFSYSDDGAATFASPMVMEDSLVRTDQEHPDLYVNNRGVLVVTWYHFSPYGPVDTHSKTGVQKQMVLYNRYATASLDGGKTFLGIQPLAQESSRLTGYLNKDWGWGLSPVRFGDYFNVVTDPAGTFHTIWMGGAGTTQMWYNSINVLCGGKPAAAHAN
jgi:hypothetical protein